MSELEDFRQNFAGILDRCAKERRQGLCGGEATGEDLKIIALFERLARDAETLDPRVVAESLKTWHLDLVAQSFVPHREALLAQVGVLFWPKDASGLLRWMTAQSMNAWPVEGQTSRGMTKGPPPASRRRRRAVRGQEKQGFLRSWAGEFSAGFGIVAPMLSLWNVRLGVEQLQDHRFVGQHATVPATVVSVDAQGTGRSAGYATNVVLAFPLSSGDACRVTWRSARPPFTGTPGETLLVVPRSSECEVPVIPSRVGDPSQTFALAAALMAGGLASLKLWLWLFRHPPRPIANPYGPDRHPMVALTGSIVDLVTPFLGGGIDDARFADFVAWQISEGTTGLATCTTTGEGPTLSDIEKKRLIGICVRVSAGRVPVLAATGTNGTSSTIALTRMAQDAGADAALVVTPYYNRPSQEGLYRHFEAVAGAVDVPIVLHNHPARTGVHLLPGTIERLRQIPSIVGFCESGPDAGRLLSVPIPEQGFVRLCGQDAATFVSAVTGGEASLSAVANVAPRLCATLHHACREGHLDLARTIQRQLSPLIEALDDDAAPVGIKHAVSVVRPGFEAAFRLPLCAADRPDRHRIETATQAIRDTCQSYPNLPVEAEAHRRSRAP